jgi:hypothetical protein
LRRVIFSELRLSNRPILVPCLSRSRLQAPVSNYRNGGPPHTALFRLGKALRP